jgi:CO dehydrogenase/acetyl-CoA synthase epsilon subunit
MTDIRAYRERIRTSGIDLPEYPYNPNETTFDTEVWYVEKLTQLLMDKWTPDSGIYDLDAWTGSLKYFIERVKANPEKQWLIPVDFHH